MIREQTQSVHSAQVEMRLIINGASIGITHMGPDFVMIESGVDHPPGEASILFQVDKTVRRWQVKLPEGISKASKRVALALFAQPGQE